MARNAARMTDYFYEVEYDDGERYIIFFDTKHELFCELAKIYAFDDLDTGMEIIRIYCEGEPCYYTGWQPDMVIEFAALNFAELSEPNRIVWSGQFPQWDH